MPWIKSHTELLTHPKTKKAARLLGVSVITMIGHLHAFWWWSLEHTPDGIISAYDIEEIADGAGWEGNPQIFIDALLNCGMKDGSGFVDQAVNGDLVIHDWEEHCGDQYKKRMKDADRLRAWREKKREEKQRAPQDETSVKQQLSGYETQVKRVSTDVRSAYEMRTKRECNSVEREREIEIEKEKKKKDLQSTSCSVADCPHQAIVALYHEILPELPRVRDWGDKRQGLLRARWKARPEQQNLEFWREYFQSVRKMDWLMGRREGRDGRPFLATLEWLVRPGNFDKVIEGFYLPRGVPTSGGVTDAEKKALIAKYTDEEGQRDDRAIYREIRALERERGVSDAQR